MFDFFWNLRQQDQIRDLQRQLGESRFSGNERVLDAREKLSDLEFESGRQALINRAIWELVSGSLGLTEQDLVRKMQEIDRRDGVEDGKTDSPAMKVVPCPRCGRSHRMKNLRCIYCGEKIAIPPF